jgi:hypothetical protein
VKKALQILKSSCCVGVLIFIALSCNNSNTDPIDVYSYFPVEVGRYQIYQVDETVYSASQKDPTVTSWQEKDEVDKILSSDQNTTTYLVARYKRSSAGDYWQKSSEYTISKSPDRILTNIDNQTIFSFIFPLDPGTTWNGNLYNNQDPQEYHYEDIGSPGSVQSLSFDKTLAVVERYDTSIIDRYVGIKKYALGTGLIQDEQTSFQYCQDTACIGSGKVESGTYKTRKIIESGMNK